MAAHREERSMELRYQMTDILPLLPIPQPPHGRSAYNIPCPLCDRPGTREKHLNINLKRNVYRCPKCGQFQGGVFDLYAYYMGIPRDKVLEDITARLHGGSPIPSGSGGSRKKPGKPCAAGRTGSCVPGASQQADSCAGSPREFAPARIDR